MYRVQERGTEVVGTQLQLLQEQQAAGQLRDPRQLQRTEALFRRMQVGPSLPCPAVQPSWARATALALEDTLDLLAVQQCGLLPVQQCQPDICISACSMVQPCRQSTDSGHPRLAPETAGVCHPS